MKSIITNLKRASIEIILLNLLSEGDKYGYQLSQEIKKRSDKKLSILEGSVYTILTRLKNSGFVTDRQELVGAKLTRVYYSITDEGRQHLEEARNVLNEYIEVVKTVTAKQ